MSVKVALSFSKKRFDFREKIAEKNIWMQEVDEETS
jgi:hypothetical protein